MIDIVNPEKPKGKRVQGEKMMKKTLAGFVLILTVICLSAALSACGGEVSVGMPDTSSANGTQDSSLAAPGENAITGILSSVNGDTLTIEIMDMQVMGEWPKGGQMPDGSEMPSGGRPGDGGLPQASDGASFDPPESMPEGDFPQGGFPGGNGETPPTTGETKTILIDDATIFSSMDGGGDITLADLQPGALLSIELAEDGEAAAQINVMRTKGVNTEEWGVS